MCADGARKRPRVLLLDDAAAFADELRGPGMELRTVCAHAPGLLRSGAYADVLVLTAAGSTWTGERWLRAEGLLERLRNAAVSVPVVALAARRDAARLRRLAGRYGLAEVVYLPPAPGVLRAAVLRAAGCPTDDAP